MVVQEGGAGAGLAEHVVCDLVQLGLNGTRWGFPLRLRRLWTHRRHSWIRHHLIPQKAPHQMHRSKSNSIELTDCDGRSLRSPGCGFLRPAPSLQARLAQRIATETGGKPVLPSARQWVEPEWEDVAPGISCKLLATDTQKHVISMLVRLAPGGEYPPHTHAGVEELHLLDGELWIDDRKLYPGDYNRAEPGTGDKRVWSETGCTCVLITSTRDILR